jgi:hypothetical protein
MGLVPELDRLSCNLFCHALGSLVYRRAADKAKSDGRLVSDRIPDDRRHLGSLVHAPDLPAGILNASLNLCIAAPDCVRARQRGIVHVTIVVAMLRASEHVRYPPRRLPPTKRGQKKEKYNDGARAGE